MTIDEEINEYTNRLCTYENQNMHRELSEWEWMHTWVTSHNALSRNGVSAQLMNTKYSSHVAKQDKEPPKEHMALHSNSFLF